MSKLSARDYGWRVFFAFGAALNSATAVIDTGVLRAASVGAAVLCAGILFIEVTAP